MERWMTKTSSRRWRGILEKVREVGKDEQLCNHFLVRLSFSPQLFWSVKEKYAFQEINNKINPILQKFNLALDYIYLNSIW